MPPPGWTEVATTAGAGKRFLGGVVTGHQGVTLESDVVATLYAYRTDPKQATPDRYVLAFRGTTGSIGDWTENLRQRTALSRYYADAARIGYAVAQTFPSYCTAENGFVFAGHSLGGGLASVAAMAAAVPAYTFNAAGVSLFTAALMPGAVGRGRERELSHSEPVLNNSLHQVVLRPGRGTHLG